MLTLTNSLAKAVAAATDIKKETQKSVTNQVTKNDDAKGADGCVASCRELIQTIQCRGLIQTIVSSII